VSEIETHTEALAFDSFTETIRGNIRFFHMICHLNDIK
jgi:hypothetical protein